MSEECAQQDRDHLVSTFEPEFRQSFERWRRRTGLFRWLLTRRRDAYVEGADTGFRAALMMSDELRQAILSPSLESPQP